MNRTIFPNLKLVKKEISERFLVALRAIFVQHPIYTYTDDDITTGILLYPSYANVGTPGKKPAVMIKSGSYDWGMMDTLYNNMRDEAKNSQGIISGFTYSKMITTSATAIVQAYAEEECSDIADELAQLMVFACRGMFTQVGLVIRGVQVGETDVVDQATDKYQTPIAVALDVPWGGQITSGNPPIDAILPDLKPVIDGVGAELREPPGVTIFQKKLADLLSSQP